MPNYSGGGGGGGGRPSKVRNITITGGKRLARKWGKETCEDRFGCDRGKMSSGSQRPVAAKLGSQRPVQVEEVLVVERMYEGVTAAAVNKPPAKNTDERSFIFL